MEPVSVHSEAESQALIQLGGYVEGQRVWLGATRPKLGGTTSKTN